MPSQPSKPRQLSFPVDQVRRYLEPGPVLLISSQHAGEHNIMTAGWHLVMEFAPSLVGCVISRSNHSHGLIRESRECVLNLPTVALADAVAGIGNCSGSEGDKFQRFGLTASASKQVAAPRVAECHASFECVLHDDSLVDTMDFFVFEVVAAHAARSPQHPPTLHYQGDGQFMVAGRQISRRKAFTRVS